MTRSKDAITLTAAATAAALLLGLPSTARADRFVYDGAHRLVRVERGAAIETMRYDGDGAPIGRCVRIGTEPIQCERVLWNPGAGSHGQVAARRADDAVIAAQGPLGTELERTAAGVNALVRDHVGSIRAVVRGASILGRRTFEPAGGVRASVGESSSFGFAGESQGPSGLVYLRSRHHAPQLGRFLQRDGFAGSETRPQSLNRYAYAENNPLIHVDPAGQAIVVAPFIAAAFVGAILGTLVAPVADMAGTMYGASQVTPTSSPYGKSCVVATDNEVSERLAVYMAANQTLMTVADFTGRRGYWPRSGGPARTEQVWDEGTAMGFGMNRAAFNAHRSVAMDQGLTIVTKGGAVGAVDAMMNLGLPAKPGTWTENAAEAARSKMWKGLGSPLREGTNELASNPLVMPWPPPLPDGWSGTSVSDGDFVGFIKNGKLLDPTAEMATGAEINRRTGANWIMHGGFGHGFALKVPKLMKHYDHYMRESTIVFTPDGRVRVSDTWSELRKLEAFKDYRAPQ